MSCTRLQERPAGCHQPLLAFNVLVQGVYNMAKVSLGLPLTTACFDAVFQEVYKTGRPSRWLPFSTACFECCGSGHVQDCEGVHVGPALPPSLWLPLHVLDLVFRNLYKVASSLRWLPLTNNCFKCCLRLCTEVQGHPAGCN